MSPVLTDVPGGHPAQRPRHQHRDRPADRSVREDDTDAPTPRERRGRTVLDIVVPVHDEQADLEPSVRRLLQHLRGRFPYSFRITIADNASTDDTPVIARRLSASLTEVRSVRLERKGRGRALHEVWSAGIGFGLVRGRRKVCGVGRRASGTGRIGRRRAEWPARPRSP